MLERFDPCDPSDADILVFDLSVNLPPGTSIVGTPTFSASPATITLPGWAVEGSEAIVWFENGESGTDYTISCHFQTSDGRRRTRSAMIFCGPQ